MAQNQVLGAKIAVFSYLKNSLRKRKLLRECLHIWQCGGIINASARKSVADYLYNMVNAGATMKKKIIITSCLAVLALTAFIAILFISPLKYRFYSGDRITGTFVMTVNGADYDPVEEILEYENEGTQRLHNDNSGFSIKGGEYGSYKISFLLDNKELYRLTEDVIFDAYTSNPVLTYQYINTNWWHITEMALTAELDLVNDEWVVTAKVVYREPLESGITWETMVEKSFTYDEIMQGEGIVQFGV